jgi:hypothetical protein
MHQKTTQRELIGYNEGLRVRMSTIWGCLHDRVGYLWPNPADRLIHPGWFCEDVSDVGQDVRVELGACQRMYRHIRPLVFGARSHMSQVTQDVVNPR